MVGEVGVEPTQLESNSFTDCPSSPTLALPYVLAPNTLLNRFHYAGLLLFICR
nr:MAG TPA: hypothetical protein [Caudoviricetes sp.]